MANRTLAGAVTAQAAADFLSELANLVGGTSSLTRFRRRFGEMIPKRQSPFVAVEAATFREREAAKRRMTEGDQDESAGHGRAPDLGPHRAIAPAEQDDDWVWELSQLLRRVWDQPDQRSREWAVFLLLHMIRAAAGSRETAIVGLTGPLSPATPFEQCLMHLLKAADRARHCQNSECPAPYFLAARRSQRYCSEACALPSQREFKRRWWLEHGAERRQRAGRARPVKKVR